MSRPQLMGILNLTPDSFSGDGVTSAQAACARFAQLAADGADIVDLGAESTRPGATPLSDAEEWQRLAPVLEALASHPARDAVKLSIDSYHPKTIRRAMPFGIAMVNDVSGLRDAAMLPLLAAGSCGIVAMHALSVPPNPNSMWKTSVDPIAEILRWKQAILQRATDGGIDTARLIFDPGIGFGKTAEQSLQLVQRAAELVASGGNWLVGHSKKSFLKLLGGNREEATLRASRMLAEAGVQILRVHDVAAHRAIL